MLLSGNILAVAHGLILVSVTFQELYHLIHQKSLMWFWHSIEGSRWTLDLILMPVWTPDHRCDWASARVQPQPSHPWHSSSLLGKAASGMIGCFVWKANGSGRLICLEGIEPYYVNGLYLLRIKLAKNCFIKLGKEKSLMKLKWI